MPHFDIQGVNRESLLKVLEASYFDYDFNISNGILNFSSESFPHSNEINRIIEVIRAASDVDNKSKYSDFFIVENVKNRSRSIDIQKLLECRGDVVWLGDGLAILSGDFLRVKRALERYWFDFAIKELGGVEIENPALWSIELTNSARYLSDFPHEAAFVLGVKKNNQSLASLANLAKSGGLSTESLEEPDVLKSLNFLGLCQSAVCTSCYYALGKKTQVRNSIYTTYNRVFRNEGRRSLDRLLSFSVRDIIAVGANDYVREFRDKFLAKSEAFIGQFLLSAQIVRATDPFFRDSSAKVFFQKSADLKHEIQAWLPYERSAIAIGSINLHLDTFGKRFSMKSDSGVAHSACMGIGFERLTFSLFAQNGIDCKDWDPSLLKVLDL